LPDGPNASRFLGHPGDEQLLGQIPENLNVICSVDGSAHFFNFKTLSSGKFDWLHDQFIPMGKNELG
jgi:hypothetical protein